ncbi:MAG: hypothetical protein IID28_15410, partial [Planctomycetes bacterium]|nr:hypothetical protein [Planctomycetota bacterium]
MRKTRYNPLPHVAVAVACTLAVAGGAGVPTADPSIPGSAVIRVALDFTVSEASAELSAAMPAVSFELADVSLSDKRLYLL